MSGEVYLKIDFVMLGFMFVKLLKDVFEDIFVLFDVLFEVKWEFVFSGKGVSVFKFDFMYELMWKVSM